MATCEHDGTVPPESVGISSRCVSDFVDNLREKRVNMHSFLLMRNGLTAAEGYYAPFSSELKHSIFSVTKSFLSAAVGIAINEGRLALDDRLTDFFPPGAGQSYHSYTRMITVRHLLTMASVHRGPTSRECQDWLAEYLTAQPDHPPGTVFAYDSTGSYALGAILHKLTGVTLHEYIKPRLLDPLGIADIEWDKCPLGRNIGGSGIRCKTRDLAKIGQLYLQNGRWEGRQLVPADWVRASVSRQIDNANASYMVDGKRGYGYQLWMSRRDAYCAFGSGGQLVLVVPSKQLVFVSTANTELDKNGQQLILDSFWDVLYPGVAEQRALPGDASAYAELQAKLAGLTLHLPEATAVAADTAARASSRFELLANPLGYTALRFDFVSSRPSLTLYTGAHSRTMPFACGGWVVGREPFTGRHAACGGVWADASRFVLYVQMLEELQLFMLTCCFGEEAVVVQIKGAGFLKDAKPINGMLMADLTDARAAATT